MRGESVISKQGPEFVFILASHKFHKPIYSGDFAKVEDGDPRSGQRFCILGPTNG
jgi:hypothetical protein